MPLHAYNRETFYSNFPLDRYFTLRNKFHKKRNLWKVVQTKCGKWRKSFLVSLNFWLNVSVCKPPTKSYKYVSYQKLQICFLPKVTYMFPTKSYLYLSYQKLPICFLPKVTNMFPTKSYQYVSYQKLPICCFTSFCNVPNPCCM
jgi:hypothetical protein